MARRYAINKTWEGKATSTPPYKVGFIINAMTGDIVLEIDAPYFNDAPPPSEPGKCLNLHEYEAVEVFLAAYPNDDDSAQYSPYLEIQIGPHGHYNLVFFLQEADFKNMDTSIELDRPPTVRINKTTGRWTAEVAVPSFFLPEPACGDDLSVTWMMNSYALHGTGEDREYLAHSPVPGPRPNFHQLNYFVPLVLFETLETRMTIDRSNSMATEKIRQSSMAYSSMGLAAGAGGDVTSRLIADVMRGGGGGPKNPAMYEDEEDESSSGNCFTYNSHIDFYYFCNRAAEKSSCRRILSHPFNFVFIVLYLLCSGERADNIERCVQIRRGQSCCQWRQRRCGRGRQRGHARSCCEED